MPNVLFASKTTRPLAIFKSLKLFKIYKVEILVPAGRGAIISQFRVWPIPSTLIMTFGERNRNPGHRFAGRYNITIFYLNYVQELTQKRIIVRI
jgi:hypothetical protein